MNTKIVVALGNDMRVDVASSRFGVELPIQLWFLI